MNAIHAEFFVKFLTSNSSALLPTEKDVMQALVALNSEISNGKFVDSFQASRFRSVTVSDDSVILEPFDYCQEQEHSCDLSTTRCQFQESSAQLLCSCLPFHARVSTLECVFDSLMSYEYVEGVQKDRSRKSDFIRISTKLILQR